MCMKNVGRSSSMVMEKIFKQYWFPRYLNTNSLLAKESNGDFVFLDINNFCERGKFITNIYHKKNHFRAVYSNFYPSLKLIISQTFITKILKNKKFRMKYWSSQKCDWNSTEWRDVLFISFPVFWILLMSSKDVITHLKMDLVITVTKKKKTADFGQRKNL